MFTFSRQDGQEGRNWKENHATKVTKIPKDKNMGWMKHKTICKESSEQKNLNVGPTFITESRVMSKTPL